MTKLNKFKYTFLKWYFCQAVAISSLTAYFKKEYLKTSWYSLNFQHQGNKTATASPWVYYPDTKGGSNLYLLQSLQHCNSMFLELRKL